MPNPIVLSLISVALIAIGQLLLKSCAILMTQTEGLLNTKLVATFIFSLAIYGIATITWILALRDIDLNKAYPIAALAFVLVPLGSHFLLGEKLTFQYAIGILLICAGIVIAFRAPT